VAVRAASTARIFACAFWPLASWWKLPAIPPTSTIAEKLASYQQIPSLDSIVILSHRERLIKVFERTSAGTWARTEARAGQRAVLASVQAELSVDEIYDSAQLR
jgi:hypothetical protein